LSLFPFPVRPLSALSSAILAIRNSGTWDFAVGPLTRAEWCEADVPPSIWNKVFGPPTGLRMIDARRRYHPSAMMRRRKPLFATIEL
jgi:hypothetical protein